MLRAGKKLAFASLSQQRINVLERELNFYQTNLQALGAQASLLAGFGSAGMGIGLPDDAHWLLLATFPISSVVALVSNMLAVIFATWCNIYPAHLALLGPEGALSVSRAVLYLRHEYKWTLWLHLTGVFFFVVEAGVLSWLLAPGVIAITVTGVIVAAILAMLFQQARIEQRFDLGNDAPPDQAKKLLSEMDTDPSRSVARQIPKAGQLVKRGHFRHNWKLRHCQVDQGALRYFRNEYDTEPAGTVTLTGKQISLKELEVAQFGRPHCFVLTFMEADDNGYALYLQAPNDMERTEWMHAIQSWGRDTNLVTDLVHEAVNNNTVAM